MKVLLITTHLNIGGISSYLLSLSKGLKARGYGVYLASSGGELSEKFKEQGINLIPIPIKTKAEISPKIIISLFKLMKAVKEEEIDVIHANTRVTQVLACLLSKNTHKPFISTCHGFFKKRFFRRLFPCWGRKVIAISESVREHLIQDFRLEEINIKVIHNGIDVERFKSESRNITKSEMKEKLGLKDGPVVGIVARLSDVKGHIYLIEAMKLVLEKAPTAQLLIVGSGKMQNELLNLTASLKIEKSVKFIPSVSDTKEVLSVMDIFVMPSLNEGLGLGLMEAMASGLAVVGSYVGGIKTLIQDGHTGILVRPKEVKELSAAIILLLLDEEKRRCLGDNARIFIGSNFSIEKMAEETAWVYEVVRDV
ncbi:MAG: glycosyltransferase family 4 protein [Candidatus Omnitrophica bacterium]|nr:glycosyltransferase family 4 protein [Candidatus Omnitrophota bacterium]